MGNNALDRTDSWFDGRVRVIPFVRHCDPRGQLLPIALDELPFAPRRIFTVSGVPTGTERGGHGHRTGSQLLICVSGEIRVQMHCAGEEVAVTLFDTGPGLVIGAGIWVTQTYLNERAALLVICSEPFSADAYFHQKDNAQ